MHQVFSKSLYLTIPLVWVHSVIRPPWCTSLVHRCLKSSTCTQAETNDSACTTPDTALLRKGSLQSPTTTVQSRLSVFVLSCVCFGLNYFLENVLCLARTENIIFIFIYIYICYTDKNETIFFFFSQFIYLLVMYKNWYIYNKKLT